MKPNWMENLPEEMKDRQINRIKIPGTHNSGSYYINLKSSIINTSDNSNKWINNFAKLGLALPCAKNIIKDWTLNNDINVYDQLHKGIRYLDLRITFNEIFYISHSFITVKLSEVLLDILRFLDDYKEEVIILQFGNDYNQRATMPEEKINEVINIIEKAFEGQMYESLDIFPTYKEMVETKKRILCYYTQYEGPSNYIWKRRMLYGPWIDTSDLDKRLNSSLANINIMTVNPTIMNLVGLPLTPQTSDIVKDVVLRVLSFGIYKGNNLKKLSEIILWVADNIFHADNIDSVSIITTDFPTDHFIEKVIDLNKP